MTDLAKRLSDKLEKEGRKTIQFFSELVMDDWEKQVYSEGAQWTVRELLTHIVETEQSIPRLVTDIVGGGEGVPEGFDTDAYNEGKVEESGVIPVEVLLQNFAHRRAWTVELVAGMSEEDLSKKGRHPFLGEDEVEEMLRLMYLHVQIHIRDVRKVLEG